MELRQLRYFACVYEEGGITKASRRLNIVQPALSTQISKLEAEIGQVLFERSRSGLVPTLAAQKMYELFAPILRDITHAQEAIKDDGAVVRGHVLGGMVTSVNNSVLAAAVETFASSFPSVTVTIIEGYSTSLQDHIMSRAVDFALINRPGGRLNMPMHHSIKENMCIIRAPATKVLRPGGPMREMHDLALVLPSKRHGLRRIMDQQAGLRKTELKPLVELDSLTAILELVMNTHFVTILPPMAALRELASGALVGDELVDPVVSRELVWIHHPRRVPSQAERSFMSVVNSVLRDANAEINKKISPAPQDSPPQ